MKYTLLLLVNNQIGAVAGVTDVFKLHNINLNSVSCAETENFETSRLIVTFDGTSADLETLKADLAAKDFMLEVDSMDGNLINRELALVNVSVCRETTTQIMQVCEVFRASVVDMEADSMTMEITGDVRKVDGFIRLLRPFGIRSLARTGAIALPRGNS